MYSHKTGGQGQQGQAGQQIPQQGGFRNPQWGDPAVARQMFNLGQFYQQLPQIPAGAGIQPQPQGVYGQQRANLNQPQPPPAGRPILRNPVFGPQVHLRQPFHGPFHGQVQYAQIQHAHVQQPAIRQPGARVQFQGRPPYQPHQPLIQLQNQP